MCGSRGGTGGPDLHPEKSQKYRVSLQFWSRFPKNNNATEPTFNVGPAKRHLKGVSLAGR